MAQGHEISASVLLPCISDKLQQVFLLVCHEQVIVMTCCLWCERVLLILLSVELMATVKPWIWRNVQKLSLSLSIPGSDSRRLERLVWGDAALELEMVSLSTRYLKWFPLNTPTMEELRRQRRSWPAGAAIKHLLCTEISKGVEDCKALHFNPKGFLQEIPVYSKGEEAKSCSRTVKSQREHPVNRSQQKKKT